MAKRDCAVGELHCRKRAGVSVLLSSFLLCISAHADLPAGSNSAAPQGNRFRGFPHHNSIEPPRRMRAKGYPWDHEIQIALPPSYGKTDKTYPVLWVTDGLWNFNLVVETVDLLGRTLPELIVVGVGAPPEAADQAHLRRAYDFYPSEKYTPVPFGNSLSELKPPGQEVKLGGAAAFLSFLVDTVRPTLSKEYRFSSEHILFGHSGGGMFCTYALLDRPESFDKYICGSPSLWSISDVFKIEEEYAATHKDLKADVFFGFGESEASNGDAVSALGVASSTTRIVEILSARHYPSLKLHFRVFPGEDHATSIPLNLSWGLQSVLGGK